MYCPSCGKSIPDESKFCLHCGVSILTDKYASPLVTPSDKEPKYISQEGESAMVGRWEYKDYVMGIPPLPDKPFATIGGSFSLTTARNEAWAQVRPVILDQLKEWQDQGWEPVATIGPDCLAIETKNKRELGGDNALFGVNTYAYLKEIRIQMRRLKE